MNTYYHSDDILPPDLQDVPVIPLRDPGAFQASIETCQANWNNNYPNYGGSNLFAQSEERGYSRSQNGAENIYSPYTETSPSPFAASTGTSSYPVSSSNLLSQANNNNYNDELSMPEEDNSLRPAWPASASMPGSATSSLAMLREDTVSSALRMNRGENDSSVYRLRLDDDSSLNNFNQTPSWAPPRPHYNNLQVSSRNELYSHSGYLSHPEAVSTYVPHEHFSNNSCFSERISEFSADSAQFEHASEDSGSDGGRQVRKSKQKPRQRKTKEEYSRMTLEQLEALRRENMRKCSKEYRARKKQEQDGYIRDLEMQEKLNEELIKKKSALERQKEIMETSLGKINKDFGNLELLNVAR